MSAAGDAALPQRPEIAPRRIETRRSRIYREAIRQFEEDEIARRQAREESAAKVEQAGEDLKKCAVDSKKFPLPKRSG